MATMTVQSSSGSLSWAAVPGAAAYVVVVDGPAGTGPLWSWAGHSTSATVGDTTLDGVTGSGDDDWEGTEPAAQSTWTVLALDSAGRIVGGTFAATL